MNRYRSIQFINNSIFIIYGQNSQQTIKKIAEVDARAVLCISLLLALLFHRRYGDERSFLATCLFYEVSNFHAQIYTHKTRTQNIYLKQTILVIIIKHLSITDNNNNNNNNVKLTNT